MYTATQWNVFGLLFPPGGGGAGEGSLLRDFPPTKILSENLDKLA